MFSRVSSCNFFCQYSCCKSPDPALPSADWPKTPCSLAPEDGAASAGCSLGGLPSRAISKSLISSGIFPGRRRLEILVSPSEKLFAGFFITNSQKQVVYVDVPLY